MFDARRKGDKALSSEFHEYMHEVDEGSNAGSDGQAGLNITWANEMQVTTGEDIDECPFSEDEEIELDFPEEGLNDWHNREWRDAYEIALVEAFQKTYDHNEAVKHDPEKKGQKPKDINPFWSHALQEIRHRNRREDDEIATNLVGLSELPILEPESSAIEDQSDITASAIPSDTTSGEVASEMHLSELNDAVLDIDNGLLAETIGEEMDTTGAEMEMQDDEVAEVLVIERQNEVISPDINANVGPVVQEGAERINASVSNNRFDAESFKARLTEFRKRQEIEWIFNINKNSKS